MNLKVRFDNTAPILQQLTTVFFLFFVVVFSTYSISSSVTDADPENKPITKTELNFIQTRLAITNILA